MKKVLLSLGVVAAMAMTSCGGHDMCSCAETRLEAMKEMEAAGDDEAKLKEIEEKYKADEEACKKLGDEMKEEMKDLSDEDKMKKMEEMMDECPAFKELMGH
ncbi:MAG: hypothetical protein H6599_11285 [Flavobacteriales bacterium]|nr:hypothetical protein [Flavobacteriales bacterium]